MHATHEIEYVIIFIVIELEDPMWMDTHISTAKLANGKCYFFPRVLFASFYSFDKLIAFIRIKLYSQFYRCVSTRILIQFITSMARFFSFLSFSL